MRRLSLHSPLLMPWGDVQAEYTARAAIDPEATGILEFAGDQASEWSAVAEACLPHSVDPQRRTCCPADHTRGSRLPHLTDGSAGCLQVSINDVAAAYKEVYGKELPTKCLGSTADLAAEASRRFKPTLRLANVHPPHVPARHV